MKCKKQTAVWALNRYKSREKGDLRTNENRYPDCTGSEYAAH